MENPAWNEVVGTPVSALPVVSIRAGKEKLLRNRHPWGFSGAIERISHPATDGDLVRVVDSRGRFIAYAGYNSRSQTALRLLEWDVDRVPGDEWWSERVRESVARRSHLLSPQDGTETDACRLVHAEADYLPGVVCDYYAGFISIQITTAVAEVRKALLLDALIAACATEHLPLLGIYERGDLDVRKIEGLDSASGTRWGKSPPEGLTIQESGLQFGCSIVSGQKSGFYCDQRNNRLRVESYSRDRNVLDAFCYSGAFGVHALRSGARTVHFVDSSADAVVEAEKSVELNRHRGSAAGVTFDVANVFEFLRAIEAGTYPYDYIILDPPKLAMSAAHLSDALRAYKDLNMWAIRALPVEGLLATFSCSGRVSREDFRRAVAWAANDAGREVHILETLGQPEDHPVRLSFPESEYLKGYLLRVVR